MARPRANDDSIMIGVRVPLKWIKRIDDLRRLEPHIPSRSIVVLQLIQVGIEQTEAKRREKNG